MFYSGEFHFYNDGDFHVDLSELNDFIEFYKLEENFLIYGEQSDGYLTIEFQNLTERGFDRLCCILMVSFRVSYTHYYVLKDLYNLVNGAWEWGVQTHPCNNEQYTDRIYGNYDGTECFVITTENPIQEKIKEDD